MNNLPGIHTLKNLILFIYRIPIVFTNCPREPHSVCGASSVVFAMSSLPRILRRTKALRHLRLLFHTAPPVQKSTTDPVAPQNEEHDCRLLPKPAVHDEPSELVTLLSLSTISYNEGTPPPSETSTASLMRLPTEVREQIFTYATSALVCKDDWFESARTLHACSAINRKCRLEMARVVKEHLRALEADHGETGIKYDLRRWECISREVLEAKLDDIDDDKALMGKFALTFAIHQHWYKELVPVMCGKVRWLLASLEGREEDVRKAQEKYILFTEEELTLYQAYQESSSRRRDKRTSWSSFCY